MFLKCDGPFGDRNIVSKDAIESIKVFEMADSETERDHTWDVALSTFIDTHKYGSYLSREEAEEVADGLARILDGEHEHEPAVTVGEVEEKLGAWLKGRSVIADAATPS